MLPWATNILRDVRGGSQGAYAGIVLLVGVMAAGSIAFLGSTFSSAVDDSVHSTPPDVDSYAFISTHDPTYNVGSVTLGSGSDDQTGSSDGSDGTGTDGADDSSGDPGLDAYNECLAQGMDPAECAATHLGETDVTSSDSDDPSSNADGTGLEDSSADNGLGSSSQAGTETYGEAPDYGSSNNNSGGGGWSFGDFAGNALGGFGRVAGNVFKTAGQGLLGVVAGVGGAAMGSVAGIFNGEGFLGGMKNGWNQGWNACHDGGSTKSCLGYVAAGVGTAAVVAGAVVAGGTVLGISAGAALAATAGFVAKSLLAGAVYSFFLNGDTLGATWQDIKTSVKERRFTLSTTAATIGGKFRGCVDSPGGCVASIATGAVVYGAFKGIAAAFRGLVAAPIAQTIMRPDWAPSGIMRLPFMQNLAPKITEQRWLLKVPGFRAASKAVDGSGNVANALRFGRKTGAVEVVDQASTTVSSHLVTTSSKQAQSVIANQVNTANRNALGVFGHARSGLSRSLVADRGTARPVVATFDPKSGLLRHVLPSVAARPTTWYGRMLDSTLIGLPTFAGTHAAVGTVAGGVAANSATSRRLANWFDEQERGVDFSAFNLLDATHGTGN